MIKNIFYTLFALFSVNILNIYAGNSPTINCWGLPWCWDNWYNDDKIVEKISANIITEMIKYIAVLAVIALMISWIMYMISGWEEEKVKKAKTWIIWSLVGVLLSISSYYIVSSIINININI
jgi:hypothetical protein